MAESAHYSVEPPPPGEEHGTPPAMQDVIDDLAMRFVVNCPAEEQESFERLLFQVEAAFWFYDDQYREIWPHHFKTHTLLTFAQELFTRCPLLSHFQHRAKEIYDVFIKYKSQIPTCGAMILNPGNTKLLLVKAWKGPNWGFPKGKIDRDEDKVSCATREVLEEVGYDITGLVDPSAYIETTWKTTMIRLYIVSGVPEDTVFETRTKKEIGDIRWHRIKDLPVGREDQSKGKPFWMVGPFVGRLVAYLQKEKKKKGKGQGKEQKEQKEQSKAEGKSDAKADGAAGGGKGAATAAPLGVAKPPKPTKAEKKAVAKAAAEAAAAGAAATGAVQVLQRAESKPKGQQEPRGAASKPATAEAPPPTAFLDFAFDRRALTEALGLQEPRAVDRPSPQAAEVPFDRRAFAEACGSQQPAL